MTDHLELIFDTVKTSRKYSNLKANPSIAFVIGWDNEVTIQYEGVAEEPSGSALPSYKEAYFRTWPDGRERETWPDIAYFHVLPKWVRYSDFSQVPEQIVEMTFDP